MRDWFQQRLRIFNIVQFDYVNNSYFLSRRFLCKLPLVLLIQKPMHQSHCYPHNPERQGKPLLVFDKSRPEIEPWSPAPAADTITT